MIWQGNKNAHSTIHSISFVLFYDVGGAGFVIRANRRHYPARPTRESHDGYGAGYQRGRPSDDQHGDLRQAIAFVNKMQYPGISR
jgi:hypothetical protein